MILLKPYKGRRRGGKRSRAFLCTGFERNVSPEFTELGLGFHWIIKKEKTGPHKARITIRVMLLLHHSRVNGPCQTQFQKTGSGAPQVMKGSHLVCDLSGCRILCFAHGTCSSLQEWDVWGLLCFSMVRHPVATGCIHWLRLQALREEWSVWAQ